MSLTLTYFTLLLRIITHGNDLNAFKGLDGGLAWKTAELEVTFSLIADSYANLLNRPERNHIRQSKDKMYCTKRI